MKRPVYDMLRSVSQRTSMHMPGHKGRAPFGPADLYALDTTELPVTDDLYSAENGLKEASALYARAAGAGATMLLHNGSTCGIHAMLMLYAREGDTVLLPRNAHLSAVNACILGGLRAEWMPVTQRPDGYCYVAEQTVLDALAQHPQAKTVLLTRPDYFGCCMPLERIVEKARALGVRVVVDEAHGAHLPWMEAPVSAGRLGADAWVQSVHKTLPGLTGAAVLHLADARDEAKALQLVRREQTSSPSFLLMLSIDDSRAVMEQQGRPALSRAAAMADALRSRLPRYGYCSAHEAWADTHQQFDRTRLVIEAPQGGHALAEALQARGIDVEMADRRRVVLILTAQTTQQELDGLEQALAEIVPQQAETALLPDVTALPPKQMELRAAAMADCERVPLSQAAGRMAAVAAGLYPPGIPQVCPGEIIPQAVVDMLLQAGAQQRFGVEGDSLLCVKL